MSLISKMGLKGTVADRPTIRPNASKDVTGASIEAVVENKPQLLRPINPMIDCKKPAPTELTTNAQFVFNGLLSCFKKAGYVKEGLTKDLLFGFQVSYPSDLERVAFGLIDLQRAGYITFQAQDGAIVDENCTNLSDCWIHYTERMINHVYGN